MRTNRRTFLQQTSMVLATLGLGRVGASAAGAPFQLEFRGEVICPPKNSADWPAFRAALAAWKAETRTQLAYDDTLYRRAEFSWAASSYNCCFLMTCDERFYDARRGRYTVDAFLDQGQREFGGFDSVVLWQAYPRIGADERNQFDFYRDQPGGLKGLQAAVRRFHRRGVRVYIDYNPWDQGTRREAVTDVDALVEMVKALEADGIFLDTMNRGASELRAKLDEVRPGVILEGEGAVPLERLHDHHASWAQWFSDSPVPGIIRHKWIEPRHMLHHIKRWDRDHSGELQAAWMNGTGMMVWENVFGSWMPWNARDRSWLRAMVPIQRRFTRLFTGERWTPLVPVRQRGVFASLWEADGLRLWTLVNQETQPVSGPLLRVAAIPGQEYFDLLAGHRTGKIAGDGTILLSGVIPARGLGCFVAGADRDLGKDFGRFLRRRAGLMARMDLDTSVPQVETRLTPLRRSVPLSRAPDGMFGISPATLELSIDLRVRECGFYDSAPPPGHRLQDSYRFQLQNFRRTVAFGRFAIDETPVTNAEFARFLNASRYRPRHPEKFLRHWTDGRVPAGLEDHPVVYVDLADARAFARWAGKRLPTEEEWQYAAQGTDGRKYPWGNQMEPGRCNTGETAGTTSVRAFPKGRSPLGCYDMCGNVWHWTESERSDGRTRFCILRGGSWFAARGSNWYLDGGPRPVDFATKFLLTWPGLDRCSTIGFRCAVDLTRPR